jgi:hypothetical protein
MFFHKSKICDIKMNVVKNYLRFLSILAYGSSSTDLTIVLKGIALLEAAFLENTLCVITSA